MQINQHAAIINYPLPITNCQLPINPMIASTTKLARSPDASYQVVAGEAILIHLKTGVYYSLNEVGTAFWNLLDGTRTIGDCAQAIAELIVEDKPLLNMIESDLLEISQKLTKENLASVL
jgi:hypothetical protein